MWVRSFILLQFYMKRPLFFPHVPNRLFLLLHGLFRIYITSQALPGKSRIRQAEQTCIRHMYMRVHASSHATLDVYKNGNSLSSAHTHLLTRTPSNCHYPLSPPAHLLSAARRILFDWSEILHSPPTQRCAVLHGGALFQVPR